MSLRVEQSDLFLVDLNDAFEYGMVSFGELAAESFSRSVDEWVSIIAKYPSVGSQAEGFEEDSRKILIKPYWLYYRKAQDSIVLLRLIRTEREST